MRKRRNFIRIKNGAKPTNPEEAEALQECVKGIDGQLLDCVKEVLRICIPRRKSYTRDTNCNKKLKRKTNFLNFYDTFEMRRLHTSNYRISVQSLI